MIRKDNYVVYIGASQIDEYYRADRWPDRGSKCVVKPMEPMLGGMIANAACILANYDHKTYLLDTLNYSELSDFMITELTKYGLDLSYIYRNADIADSKTIIILDGGERTIFVVDSGRPPLEVDDAHFKLLSEAAYLYSNMSDYRKLTGMEDIIGRIKKAGTKIAIDADSHAVMGENKRIFSQADLLFINDFGFDFYRGVMPEDECFSQLFSMGIETVVVTRGADGCEVRTSSQRVRLPGIKVDLVDSTGAGDTFNSSFLYATLHGYCLEDCAKFANAAAARSVTRMGPRGGAAKEADVLAAMKEFYR